MSRYDRLTSDQSSVVVDTPKSVGLSRGGAPEKTFRQGYDRQRFIIQYQRVPQCVAVLNLAATLCCFIVVCTYGILEESRQASKNHYSEVNLAISPAVTSMSLISVFASVLQCFYATQPTVGKCVGTCTGTFTVLATVTSLVTVVLVTMRLGSEDEVMNKPDSESINAVWLLLMVGAVLAAFIMIMNTIFFILLMITTRTSTSKSSSQYCDRNGEPNRPQSSTLTMPMRRRTRESQQLPLSTIMEQIHSDGTQLIKSVFYPMGSKRKHM